MTPSSLQEIPAHFLRGMNAGDVDGVVALYEDEGVVASDPTRPVNGRTAIRTMITRFLAQHPVLTLQDAEVVQAGDLALIQARWTVTTTDTHGKPSNMIVQPTLVSRRQPDGSWRVVIDRPRMAP